MKANFKLLLFTGFLSAQISSEVIDGPANVRNAPNGKILFSLRDSVHVEFLRFENNWYEIGILAFIDTSDVMVKSMGTERIFVTKERVNIKDSSNDIIGHIQDTVHYSFIEGVTDFGCYEFGLEGYTHNQNIKPLSAVENALDSLLRYGKTTRSDFSRHLTDFPYREWFWDSYILYESWFLDISATERIILFFEDNELFAVQYREDNSRMDEKLFIKVSTLPLGRRIGYISKIPEDKIKVFEDSLSYIIDRAD